MFRRAFTLVELLVVIVIISMLVGLLTPALISARGRARIAQCTNNQHELALAITQYDIAKQHLPGYANKVGNYAVTWIPVLFPFLGRMDLWESTPGWRTPNAALVAATPPTIKEFVCPDDNPASVAPLSYVVNVGNYSGRSADPTGANWNGVFRDLLPNVTNGGVAVSMPPSISMSNITSPSRRPMIAECTYSPCPSKTVDSATTHGQWYTNVSSITVANLQGANAHGRTLRLLLAPPHRVIVPARRARKRRQRRLAAASRVAASDHDPSGHRSSDLLRRAHGVSGRRYQLLRLRFVADPIVRLSTRMVGQKPGHSERSEESL